jgi:hypothetical protein
VGNETYVTEKECKLITQNVTQQLDRDEKRLNDHGKNIDELTNISAKLTIIVDNQGKTIDDHSKRIASLEKSTRWYDTDIGKYLIKAGIWLIFIIVAAAIGLNAMDALKTAQSIKP